MDDDEVGELDPVEVRSPVEADVDSVAEGPQRRVVEQSTERSRGVIAFVRTSSP